MNVVGRVGSFITQGMYSVATPFHPFGGAVDIIVVKQHDGTFRTTPWYVRFGKFQGVLKGAEKLVKIEVNGVEANFHMQLDNSGEAYFVREVDRDKDVDNLEEISGGKVKFDDNEFKGRDERVSLGLKRLERVDSDSDRIFYEFQDELSSLEGSEYGSSRFDNLDSLELENSLESQDSNSEVVWVNVDGLMLKEPISSSEINAENLQLSTPQFHLGPGKGTEEYNTVTATWGADYLSGLYASTSSIDSCTENTTSSLTRGDVFKSCVEFSELALEGVRENTGFSVEILEDTEDPDKKSLNVKIEEENQEISRNHVTLTELQVEDANSEKTLDTDYDGPDSILVQCLSDAIGEDTAVKVMQSGEETPAFKDECDTAVSNENMKSDLSTGLEISLCGHLLNIGMGSNAADEAFDSNRISREEFKLSSQLILKNENLIVRVKGKYLPYNKAAHIILGMAAFDLDLPIDSPDVILAEHETPKAKEDDIELTLTPSRRWRLWPIPFRRVKSLEHSRSNVSSEDVFVDSESVALSQVEVTTPSSRFSRSPLKQIIRTNVPTTDQIASLNLKEGQNMVNFVFSTRVLGSQKVQAHIYLWKWNTRIVISDVDGTITKSDVLGQFMPLVGKDWTHSGIARLFGAIKENGYQLLFLSARAIVQSYLTKSFLSNLKQDGKSLPNGPVVISPDGLFPSLYREVIRRAPHEFKIACLEDIKALFPPNYNPFYAGFGNRDTDELSYRKIGIPKGKIFIINPKGEVAINHRIDVKSYTSLHTLVHDMFPPTSLVNDMLSPTSLVEQEEYNSWNYWKTPLPDID